ncbi:MAG: GAP family protein [Thermomicrobiales bacterium]
MGTLVSLVALALVDSTSIGTLVVPLLLVVHSRKVQARPLAVYLGTVAGLYFLVGVALLFGAHVIADRVDGVLEAPPVQWAQLVLGVVLAAYGIFANNLPGAGRRRPDVPPQLSPKAMVALGTGSVAVELATMLPYLAAIGLIASLDAVVPVKLAVLLGYCLVMILPAVLLIALAAIFGARIWRRLERIIAWVEGQVAETMLWVAALVGIYLAAAAAASLGLIA